MRCPGHGGVVAGQMWSLHFKELVISCAGGAHMEEDVTEVFQGHEKGGNWKHSGANTGGKEVIVSMDQQRD